MNFRLSQSDFHNSDYHCPADSLADVDSILQEGDQGAEVVRLQQLLNAHGANIYVDGVFGLYTKVTVMQFQKMHGLNPTGLVNSKTRQALLESQTETSLTQAANNYIHQRALHQRHAIDWLQHQIPIAIMEEFNQRWSNRRLLPEPMLYRGAVGDSVLELTALLYKANILPLILGGKITHYFDGPTEIAVIQFQRQNGLMDDGIVGPTMWRILRRLGQSIPLSRKLASYNPFDRPWQKAALIWLQNQLPDIVLTEFSLRWQYQKSEDSVSLE